MTQTPSQKQRWWILAVALLGVAAGAAGYGLSPTASTNVKLSPEEAEIVDTAKKALGGRQDWTLKPHKKADGSWEVFAESVPPIVGGHCLIFINNKRIVTKIEPGA